MGRVISAVSFFPRGGSAHAARGLARELPSWGWSVRLVSGSRPDLGPDADARSFYRGLDLVAVELDAGPDPLRHVSYEDRPDSGEPFYAALDDVEFERLVRGWERILADAGAASADVLHLHHLTPMNEAAGRVAPGVPVVGQLHGTELLMLERIDAGAPASWSHAERWRQRMIGWARACPRMLAAPGGVDRAVDLLGLERERVVALPNGFAPELFRPRDIDRLAHWRRHLVEEPRGWVPGEAAGSVAYRDEDLVPFADGVVLVYVGRFTEVKRVPLLIRAYARAQRRFRHRAALVLIGGYPREWEGEHPAEAIASSGARDVFLAGWHDHAELPPFLAAADAFVFASVREQFGLTLVEAMACELPAVAASSFGARSIVEPGTGWLVPPDDEDTLAEALVEVVNDDAERRRRGRRARGSVIRRYSWPLVAKRAAETFELAAQEAKRPDCGEALSGSRDHCLTTPR
jgi:glycosyltransferase involved in cell wall biosynthesis